MTPNSSASIALAEVLAPKGAARLLTAVLLVFGGTALLAISAKIQVPFYPVPMTLQTLVVLLLGALYGSRLAVLTVLAYLAEGAIGLPVFAGTPPAVAGPTYLLGPTGGFLAGFVVTAAIAGIAADRGWARSALKLFGAMLVGEVALMTLGFLWLAWFAWLQGGATGLGAGTAFSAAVAPFALGELVKTALAALLVPAILSGVEKRRHRVS